MKLTASAEKNSNVSDILIEAMSQRKPVFKFAVCVNNAEYPASLELHKIYRIIPDEDAASDGDLRVIDESGEDYLYPGAWFVFVQLPPAVERSVRRAA